MKKRFIILIIVALLIGGGTWWYFSSRNNNNIENSYQANKSSTNVNTTQNTESNNNTNANNSNKTTQTNNTNTQNRVTVPKVETEIASFSTKIYNKDKERQNNITITCQTLSTKEVQPGEIFSFCDTVGKSTTDKGYQEADIYVDGEKKQGLGGGNCQVSTTLYNAVIQIPQLEITERHKHSGHVPYIEEGKDAAVAYGSYDFKFKNNTENVIKIVIENSQDNITAKIIKIS